MPLYNESFENSPENAPISVTLVEAMQREEVLKARIVDLENANHSTIFNHNQAEVVTYLLRLL
jgi:hypothetical protein